MHFVDANIVLRYILEDHDELSPKAKDIIDTGKIFLPTEVIAEIVYVLIGVYDIPRIDVSQSLISFLELTDCAVADEGVIVRAFELFGETSFDFVDCVLLAYAEAGNQVSSFDKKLNGQIKRIMENTNIKSEPEEY